MMELHQQHNPSLLPAVASSHYDIVPSSYPELSGQNRVLQEGCGNRQQDGYADTQQHYQLSSSKLLPYRDNAENAYRPVTGHVHYQHHHPVRSYYNEEERKKKDIEKLWRRLNSCHAYRKYRSRQPTKVPNDGEQKWPDSMEKAFCAALVEHPPMGRRKQTMDHDPKPRGRNELIADYIQKLTGVERSRKQVSSHIQVMKPMVKDDPFILQYLSKPEDNRNRHRVQCGMNRMRYGGSAIHPRNFHHPQPNRLPSQMNESFLPHAVKFDRELNAKDGDGNYFPVLFEMHVADTGREPAAIVHRFTGFGATPRQADCSLDDERSWSWRQAFPPLAASYDEGSLTSRVVFCNARLTLLPQPTPANARLEILLDIDTPQYLASSEGLHCTTSFFEDGALVNQQEKPVGVNPDEYSRCRVAFSATYWAGIISAWQKALRNPHLGRRADAEMEVRDALGKLSAVQEVVYRSPHTGESQLLLLMCWKFDFVKDHGTTTWQNVNYRGEQTEVDVKDEGKDTLLLNTPAEQVTAGYSHSMMHATNSFGHGSFELGNLANVAIPGLTSDLDPAVIGAEAFSANEIDFNGGSVQVCMDSNLPIEAYADTSQGFDEYSRASSIAMGGGDWASQYPGAFDQSQYHPAAFVPVTMEHGKDEGMLGSQHFALSPLAHMRTEAGALQHP